MKRILAFLALAALPLLALAQANPNLAATIAVSAARTSTLTSADQTNTSWRGVVVTINISAYTSGTWTPKIQGKDPVSGNYYDILTGAALNGTGLTTLQVCPACPITSNVSSSAVLPRTWRVVVTGAASPIATFSVGALLAN